MNSFLTILTFTLLLALTQTYTIQRMALTDLTSTDQSSFTSEVSSWSVTNLISSSIKVYSCNGNYYLGGWNITTYTPVFSKTYNNLPAHDIIHFSFYMGLFDSWDSTDSLQIKFGTITIVPAVNIARSGFISTLCGNTGYPDLPHYQVQGRISHNSSSLDLEVINLMNEPSTNESFGFREILLVFLTNVSQKAQEIFAQAPTYGLTALKYACTYDFTTESCQACHANCSSCFGPSSSQCFQCSPGYFFNGDTCMFCFYHTGDDVTCHAECEYPLVVDSTVPNTCRYPCDNGQVVWSDGTCHDICQYPLLRKGFPKGDACEYICGGDTTVAIYSYNWATSAGCYNFCPSPLRTSSTGSSCEAPLCVTKICSQCQITSNCNENYVCNTTIGGFCILNVEYKLSASIVKSITNGYVLLVQVNPTQDLIESVDDVLGVTVDGLLSGTDYKLTKTKTALGVFQVTIVALQALTVDQILLSFGYSPTRLKLTAQISLPNVIFISESITKAAESIGSASNVGSYIFMVCIVIFAVLGSANKVWSSLIINQYMHYLLFLSVEFLTPTQTYLESLGNYSLIFFQGETDSATNPSMLKDLKLAWPQKFIDENYPINLLESTKQIFIILGIMCSTVFLAAMILGLNNYFVQLIIRAAKKLKWNGLLQQVLTYSLPLTLASLMQINLAMFSKQSTAPSFIFSIIIFLFLVVFFGKALLLISDIPGTMYDRVLYADKYGALWRGLNLKTKWSRYYYWVVAARGVFLAYIVAFFSLFPYVQVTVILIYQCFVLSFYFWERKNGSVFVDKLLNRFSLLAECLLLVMKFLILAFKMVNDRGENDEVILYTALGIVGVGMGIQILLLGFSLFMQIKNRKQILRKLKEFFRAVTKKEKKAKIKRVRRVRRQQRKMMIHVQVSHIGGATENGQVNI